MNAMFGLFLSTPWRPPGVDGEDQGRIQRALHLHMEQYMIALLASGDCIRSAQPTHGMGSFRNYLVIIKKEHEIGHLTRAFGYAQLLILGILSPTDDDLKMAVSRWPVE